MNDSDKNASNQQQTGNSYDWLSNHGQISYEELIKIAESGTPESVERLHELADDNNVIYDESTDMTQLAEEIYSAMENGNTGVE